MKQLIRVYLSQMRERGELDVILPDLLSEMGLNVISRPGRGTRQAGVDVAAVGSIDGGPEKLYLYTIKAGDLTRAVWNTNEQSLKPSLDEILGPYIRNRIPEEHQGKPIVVCITVGGEIREQVSEDLRAFEDNHPEVAFERWNGDKLAELTLKYLLREELLPTDLRTQLRKAIAMLDEPDASVRSFRQLIRSLAALEHLTEKQRITALRQMSVCLWILFIWSRDAGNLEAAYRASEWTVLHAWEVLKPLANREKTNLRAAEAFQGVFQAYERISDEYLEKNVAVFDGKLHALSAAIATSEDLDVNLKLFDILSRLALRGIWWRWLAQIARDAPEATEHCSTKARSCAELLTSIVANNPQLLLPIQDDQAIDIWIALTFLAGLPDTSDWAIDWLGEILGRARFSFRGNGKYPVSFHSYQDLLAHPASRDDAYRKESTAGSILYPLIALWGALHRNRTLYDKVAAFKKEDLSHCTFQFWYPDDRSERFLYTNEDSHGATLTDLLLDQGPDEFLKQVFDECDHSLYFDSLSAVQMGWWPIVLLASRVHRLPLPLHMLKPAVPVAAFKQSQNS